VLSSTSNPLLQILYFKSSTSNPLLQILCFEFSASNPLQLASFNFLQPTDSA